MIRLKLIIFLIFMLIFAETVNADTHVIYQSFSEEEAREFIITMGRLYGLDEKEIKLEKEKDVVEVLYETNLSSEQLVEKYPWIELYLVKDIEEGQKAFANITTEVHLSNKHINRIIVPATRAVRDVIYNNSTGIKIEVKANNIFISFGVLQQNKETLYIKEPIELYVILDDNTVYPLIVVPKNIKASFVKLVNSGEETRKSVNKYSSLPFEKVIVDTISLILNGKDCDDFQELKINHEVINFENLSFVLQRAVKVEGSGLIAKQYICMINNASNLVMIDEEKVIKANLSSSLVAIMVDRRNITNKIKAKVIILEKVC